MTRPSLGIASLVAILAACAAQRPPSSAPLLAKTPEASTALPMGAAPPLVAVPFRVMPQAGHGKTVSAVAVSSAGLVATNSQDESIRLWDLTSGMLLEKMGRTTIGIRRLAWDAEGDELATPIGREARFFSPNRAPRTVESTSSFDEIVALPMPGARWLAALLDARRPLVALDAKMHDVFVFEMPHEEANASVRMDSRRPIAASEDGKWVAAVLTSCVAVWSTELRGRGGRCVLPLDASRREEASVALSSARDTLLVATWATDDTVPKRMLALSLSHPDSSPRRLEGAGGTGDDVAIAPDGHMAVSGLLEIGGASADVGVWDAGGKLAWRASVGSFPGVRRSSMTAFDASSIAFAPDGTLVVGTGGGSVLRLDARGALLAQFGSDVQPWTDVDLHAGSLTAAGTGGAQGYLTRPLDRLVRWDTRGLRLTSNARAAWPALIPNGVVGFTALPTSSVCPAGDAPLGLSMLDAPAPATAGGTPSPWGWPLAASATWCFPTGAGVPRTVDGPGADLGAGKLVLQDNKEHAFVVDLATGARVELEEGAHKKASWQQPIHAARVSPHGAYVAGAWLLTGGQVRVWDAKTGRIVVREKSVVPYSATDIGMFPSVWDFAFAPDDSELALVGDNRIDLVSLPGGTTTRSFRIDAGGTALAWNPRQPGVMHVGTYAGDLLTLRAGKVESTAHGHGSAVVAMSVDEAGDYATTSHEDGMLRLWRLATGDSVMLVSSDDEWLIVSDDGYFDASPHGGQLLAAVEGIRGYHIDQLALRNNRPDILFARMGLGTPELVAHFRARHERRLKKQGLTEDQLSRSFGAAPEARIVDLVRDGKFATLSFDLHAKDKELSRYNVFVNDVPLFGAEGKAVTGARARLSERIELTPGDATVEVSTFDKGGSESMRASRPVHYEGATKRDVWFLGFGVSHYQKPEYDLGFSHKDALDLGAVFTRMKGKGDVGNVHVQTYVDEQATVEAVRGAKRFLADAKVDDTVVLFVGGHGVHARDAAAEYYYATYETDAARLPETAANFELIEDLLQGIAPRRKLFLMDTCESGEREDDDAKSRAFLFERDRYIYNDLSRRTGAIVFSSSKGAERSFELRSLKNGAFTKEVLRALGSHSATKGDTLSVAELRRYVEREVPKLTSDKQHPSVDRDNLAIAFSLPIVDAQDILDREDPMPSGSRAVLPPAGAPPPVHAPAACGCEIARAEPPGAWAVLGLAALTIAWRRRSGRRAGY